jgi:hypothetical protein
MLSKSLTVLVDPPAMEADTPAAPICRTAVDEAVTGLFLSTDAVDTVTTTV